MQRKSDKFEVRKRSNISVLDIIILVISSVSMLEALTNIVKFEKPISEKVSVFFMGLSLVGFFYEIVCHLFDRFEKKNNLNEIIDTGLRLTQDNRIPDSRILQIESDLDSYFNCEKGSFRIIVVSSCVDTNEYPYMKSIWDNISKGIHYLYVTPDSDQGFINRMISLFAMKNFGDLSDVYKLVVNRISHLQEKKFFEILPHNFDLCVYYEHSNDQLYNEKRCGFVSFFEVKDYDGTATSYYYPIQDDLIIRVLEKYAGLFSQERIIQSYFSDKIECKNSRIHGMGYFCKMGEKIKEGEVLIIKGGYELHWNQLYTGEKIDSYLPIDEDLFLGAKTEDDAKEIKLFLNHSCMPNVGMKGDRAFVAMRDIAPGEELTVEYAFIDYAFTEAENYMFKCNCKTKDCRKIIRGSDSGDSRIRERYKKKYFAKYLQDKFF